MTFSISWLSAIVLGMIAHFHLQGAEPKFGSDLENGESPASHPMHEVSVLGAPTSGSFLEGIAGSIQKGCRHRFHCHTTAPAQGFLGPQTTAEPLSLRDQPGVFPAPLMGPASLTFSFQCQNSKAPFTPVVIRPDGTVFHGLPMTQSNSPQALVIASPAQTGIYTLFILAHHNDNPNAEAIVEASVNTQPPQRKTILIKSFDPSGKDAELISGEFTYIPVR